MPYDYYEILKKHRDSNEFTETFDLVREKLWGESFNFNLSIRWLKIEDIIKIRLYRFLRYN